MVTTIDEATKPTPNRVLGQIICCECGVPGGTLIRITPKGPDAKYAHAGHAK